MLAHGEQILQWQAEGVSILVSLTAQAHSCCKQFWIKLLPAITHKLNAHSNLASFGPAVLKQAVNKP